MSLLQSLEMTEKNLAAHRRNARQSRGAATPNGKERSRAANLRHGSYSKLRNEALVALGEDPVQLAALIAGAHQQWRPANAHQAWMVEHLARLQWRIQRCERRQETVEAQHVKQVEERRRERTGQLHDDYANIEGVLRGILRDALRRDFYASPGYIQAFTRAFHGQLDRGLREILEVLHRLREPEDLPEVQEPLPEGATNDRDWKETREVNEAMAQEEPLPLPEVPVAEGEERDEWREELLYLARQESTGQEEVWQPFFEKNDRPLTTAERDELVASCDKQMERPRREEEACFRRFWRLGTLLMKLQDRGEEPEEREAGSQKTTAQEPMPPEPRESDAGGNPCPQLEADGESSRQKPDQNLGAGTQDSAQDPEQNLGSTTQDPGQDNPPVNGGLPGYSREDGNPESAPAAAGIIAWPIRAINFAGASGDIDDNKGPAPEDPAEKRENGRGAQI